MTNLHVSVNPKSAATPNQAATSRPASLLPASQPAATAVTSAAAAQPAAAVVVVAADRVALVVGATGLVGRAILDRIQADKSYSAVHCVGRRRPDALPAKLVGHVTDSLREFSAPPADDVFIALGTTLKVAGSQQAFRAVDFDTVVALAQSARAAGATRLGIVSAMGADAKSPIFYNRVKGEMEDAVSQLGYDSVVFARPSLLAGDRAALAQATRPGEQLALVAMRLFKPLIPRNYRVIAAANVAAALVKAVQAGPPGRRVLLSGEL